MRSDWLYIYICYLVAPTRLSNGISEITNSYLIFIIAKIDDDSNDSVKANIDTSEKNMVSDCQFPVYVCKVYN